MAVASYVGAPGSSRRRIEEAEADTDTAPLAPDRRLVEIVVGRNREALC